MTALFEREPRARADLAGRVFAALTASDALALATARRMTGRFEHFYARPVGSDRLVPAYADASAAGNLVTATSS